MFLRFLINISVSFFSIINLDLVFMHRFCICVDIIKHFLLKDEWLSTFLYRVLLIKASWLILDDIEFSTENLCVYTYKPISLTLIISTGCFFKFIIFMTHLIYKEFKHFLMCLGLYMLWSIFQVCRAVYVHLGVSTIDPNIY